MPLARSSSGLAGTDALVAVAVTLRAWATQHPGRYAALQVAPDPEDEEAQALAGELIGTIGSAMRVYELEGDDLTDAVRLLRSLLHGFISLEHGEGFKDPRDLDASFERMVTSLDPILRSWKD